MGFMQFKFSSHAVDKISADAVLVFAFAPSDKKTSYIPLTGLETVDALLKGQVTTLLELEKFSGKRGEMLKVIPNGLFAASRVLVLGLGKKDEFVADDLRRVVGSTTKAFRKKVDSFAIVLPTDDEVTLEKSELAHLVGEALLLGSYEFGKYKTDSKVERKLATVIIAEKDKNAQAQLKNGFEKAKLFADATKLARDLVNEPPMIATPTYLADLAKDIAKSSPQISVKVLDKAECEKMGMEAFLGIARAADTPPKFIHLEYQPKGKASKEKLAIVGKGITFDSGGINVKPGDHMADMKMDMAGAAVVLGVFSVISHIQPNFPVIGLIAATPNMISGNAIVPVDVVRAMNGKTIEVLNTDAEGRVTLADSLSYAVKEKATKIIDFATLTGACMVALGPDISGLFSNNRDLAEEIKTAAFDAGEKVWELPLEKEYKAMNKSDVADIANIPSSRYGGSLTAALFLEEFVANIPWAHLDIAGPAFINKPSEISMKGGTGHGVRTVLTMLSQ
ncbi:leucyl aminopeptidase [soil metagenome]